MPKKDYAQELKEEFKKGNLKPSQLKRSKSTETLPLPKEIPLTKSKSVENLPVVQPSLNEQVQQLKEAVKFHAETAQNYLTNLSKLTPELDNTKEENKKLKETNNSLIDKNNELRLQALKDFDQIRKHDQEIEQAAEKLVETDQKNINLQVQNSQLLREKSDLEKRLSTANNRIQKLYQLKGLPHAAESNNSVSFWNDYRFLLTAILLYWLAIWLLSKNSPNNQ